tara:strand:- start:38433 stop:38654 length:222 start_codon:yes stop_codon:yes gene_type:complete
MQTIETTFAENVKRLLRLNDWTQVELAEELGVAPQNLSRTLACVHSPSLRFVERVADIFQVEICELLSKNAGN